MDLRQLTVYEQFGWINMRDITFSFVDESSSRGLEKFGENIPTSPEVIGAHILNINNQPLANRVDPHCLKSGMEWDNVYRPRHVRAKTASQVATQHNK